MSIVVVPCLPILRPQLREAWRSLVGQGHAKESVSDEAVTALLWKARALPLVLDVIADLDLGHVHFDDVVVDILADADASLTRAPLFLLAWRRDDEMLVEVVVVAADGLDDGTADGTDDGTADGTAELAWPEVALLRMAFPFRILVEPTPGSGNHDSDKTDDLKIDVSVRRFSLGRT